jgi:putative transposase
VKAFRSALGLAGSHVCVTAARPDNWVDGRTVQSFYQAADAILVEAVRVEIMALPTYGYLKAGALVNRTCAMTGVQIVNHKRFYRVMKAHSLLLMKAPKRPDSGRTHDGVVAVA